MQLRLRAQLAATIAGVSLLFGMAGRHGNAGQDRAQDKPAFRAGTELVRIEVSVLDSRRVPIRRLTAGDFSVMVDGLSRPVKAVTEIVVTPPPDESLSPPGGAAMASNRQQDAGLVVIIMDDAQTPGEPYMVANAKDAARTFLDGLAPDDRVAIVYTWDRHKSQEFTTDRALLRAAIERFLPGPSDRAGQSDFAYAYTERTVRGVLATLQTLSGHRRSVLLVSQGVRRPGRNFGLERIDADWAFRASDVLETSGARAFARIPVYSVSIAGLTAPGDRRMQFREARARSGNEWLKTLANATGALAVVDTNDVVSGVRRVLREHGSYYVIGYEPADDAGHRRLRRLQVSVNRPGATAVIRQYEPAGHEQRVRTAGLADALSGFLPVSAMPMDLVAAVVPGEDGNGAVVMGLTLDRPDDKSPAGPLSIDVRFFEPVRMRQVHSVRRDVAASEIQLVGRDAMLALRADLPPGSYHIRVAASAPGWPGAASVFGDVVVPNFEDAELSASDLVLGAGGAARAGSPDVSALVPFVPSARRVFDRSHPVVGFLRIYQSKPEPRPAKVELEVRDAEGRTMFETGEELPAERFAQASGGAPFECRIPIGDLPDGRYIVSVRAEVDSAVVERQASLLLVTPEKGGR